MTPNAVKNPPTTKAIELYHVIETRITQAIDIPHKRGGKLNIVAVRGFFAPEQRLRARWNGRISRQDRISEYRKLLEYQGLAVCSGIASHCWVDNMKKFIFGLNLSLSCLGHKEWVKQVF
jgi:hypothetical protein